MKSPDTGDGKPANDCSKQVSRQETRATSIGRAMTQAGGVSLSRLRLLPMRTPMSIRNWKKPS